MAIDLYGRSRKIAETSSHAWSLFVHGRMLVLVISRLLMEPFLIAWVHICQHCSSTVLSSPRRALPGHWRRKDLAHKYCNCLTVHLSVFMSSLAYQASLSETGLLYFQECDLSHQCSICHYVYVCLCARALLWNVISGYVAVYTYPTNVREC